MRARKIYRDKLFKKKFLLTYYFFPCLLFLITVFFYGPAEGKYVLLPFNYSPSASCPLNLKEGDHHQAIPILYEKVHFVFQVPDTGTAGLHLAVFHNNVFLKKVDLQPRNYHQGYYYFHFSVRLNIGEINNTINLTLTDEIGHVLKQLECRLLYGAVEDAATIMNMGSSPLIWYASGKQASLSKSKVYRFHVHCQKLPCANCHDLHIPDTQELDEKNGPCYQCHQNLCQDKDEKNEDEVEDMPLHVNCLVCHREDQRDVGFCQAESDICFSCHEEIMPKANLHEPLEGGECWTCHDLHGGKYNCRLRKEVNGICRSCHGGKHKGIIRINRHPQLLTMNAPLFGGKKYSCTNCHDPHSSEAKKLYELCKTCHPRYYASL